MEIVFLLSAVKTVTQPNSPDDIQICTNAGHDVPIDISKLASRKEAKITYHQP